MGNNPQNVLIIRSAKKMNIPTETDWGGAKLHGDEGYAFRHFAGKSLSEAQKLFEKDALTYQEDLTWMPMKPFKFYLRAFMDYLDSEESEGDSDGASCFISLISQKLGTESDYLTELWPRIEESLEAIKSKQDWYQADEDIYGDFTRRVAKVYKKANKPNKAVFHR